MARARSDLLQITLFKDHDSARSLQVPIAWLKRFALLGLGLVVAVALISLVALREFRAARRFDPSRVVDLEHQVAELREASEMKIAAEPSSEETTPSPEAAVGPLPLKELPPFAVEEPKLELKDGKLKIQLILKYARADGRSQNGTLLFLVQTAAGIVSFPEGLLSTSAEGEPELAIGKGERFAVSKQRDTTATIAVNMPAESIRSVNLLLFGPDQKLLQKESLDVSTLRAPR